MKMQTPDKLKAGVRTESNRANDFRLAKKPGGEIVLVGAFQWSGYDENGYAGECVEWRELPMIELHSAEAA